MIARLRPGATIDQVNAQMKTIVDRNLDRLPNLRGFAKTSGFGGYAVDMRQQLVGDVRTPLYILQVGVVLVLLIACANVANLLLMRATGRSREIAIRTTLGAGQWRLVRQMVIEGLVLSAIGGVCGLAAGLAGVRGLIALSSPGDSRRPGRLARPGDPRLHDRARRHDGRRLRPRAGHRRDSRATSSSMLKDDSTRGSASKRTGVTRATLVIAETAIAVDAARRRGPAHQELRAAAGRQSRLRRPTTCSRRRSRCRRRATRDPPARRAFWKRLVDEGPRDSGRHGRWPDHERAVQRERELRVVLASSATRPARPSRAARPPGDRRRRLLPRDADSGARGARLQRRRHRGQPAGRGRRSVPGESVLRRAERHRPADSARRPRPARSSRSSASSARSTASTWAMPVAKERIYQYATQNVPRTMAVVLKTGVDPATLVTPLREAVAVARSGAADLRRADDGPMDWPVAGDAPHADAAAVAVRRRRDGVVGDRHLRRAGVRRRAARARVRHPPGARRRPARDPHARASAGAADGGRRRRARAGGDRWGCRGTCRASCSASAHTTCRCLLASRRCCSPSPWRPATSRHAGRRASIRWSLCGMPELC